MVIRLLLLLLCSPGPAIAQAPGSAERHDIDGDYHRPDLDAPLFDSAGLKLSAEHIGNIVKEMTLIARNCRDSPAVDHRLRAHALAIALRLRPDDWACVVANGQLARGVTPSPLPVEVTVTPEGTAQRLLTIALPMLGEPQNASRQLALLLLDLARCLDAGLTPQISQLTYAATPDWHDARSPASALADTPGLRLQKARVRVLLPGLEEGQLRILTVSASASPASPRKGLIVVLPESLRGEMKGKEPLRQEVERRAAAMRAVLRRRHESWPAGWRVEFEFSAGKTAPLPQAFAGMQVTMDCLLSGVAPDPRCLIAAGVDEAGKLCRVMSVAELLPAAMQEQAGGMLVLPADAAEEVIDWLLTHPDQWPVLYHVTLHRAGGAADLMALAKSRRAGMLERSLALFDDVASRLIAASDPLAALRRPETVAQLREITDMHPHHLSASVLLKMATRYLPAFLSVKASLALVDQIARGVLSTDRSKHPLHLRPPQFQKSEFGQEADAITGARAQLHPTLRNYVTELITLAKMLDRAAGNYKAYLKDKSAPPEPPDIGLQRARAAALRPAIEAPAR